MAYFDGQSGMQTKLAQWGGSVAIRIPRMAVETLGLRNGEEVDLRIEGDALVLRRSAPSYALADLVKEAQGLTAPESLDDGSVGDETL